MKKALAQALDEKGYTRLTSVQEAVTNPSLAGKDLLVSAQTGSGKTIGFGLAIAPTLLGPAEIFDAPSSPLALVIAPTRELALQVKRELGWLFKQATAVLASTVGGMDMRDERRALARGAHIVVSTPGRLRDHITRGSIDLSALKAVVLDEADEMLDLGFREDLEFILDQAPATRQTLLFSATVPAAIAKLAENYQKDAVRIATTASSAQHADIDYRALTVSASDAEHAIINVLRYYEAPNAIVFANTRVVVNRLTTRLSNRGFPVVALSGELSQSERTHALQAMRDGRARVCVATDVAARGIDLPSLDLVIHAELPTHQDTLLHRSGRTGRAGRKGVSVLIVPPAMRKKAQRLLGRAKLQAEWAGAPSAEAVRARDEDRMMHVSDWLAEAEASEQAAVARLTERFSAEQLATAYVRLYRSGRSAPEELSEVPDTAHPRASFGPSVWFSLVGGRAVGDDPRKLLPRLCSQGQLTRADIGAIRILPDASAFEIRQSAVQGFVDAIGPGMMLDGRAALTRLETAPRIDRPAARKTQARQAGPAAMPVQAVPETAPASSRTGQKQTARSRQKPPRHGPPKAAVSKAKDHDRPSSQAKTSGPRTERTSKPNSPDAPRDATQPRRGPKPPVGKPSSKKNRARRAAKAKTSGAGAQSRKAGPGAPGKGS